MEDWEFIALDTRTSHSAVGAIFGINDFGVTWSALVGWGGELRWGG